MGQFDKFSSKEFINGIVKLSEMIDEALLITDKWLCLACPALGGNTQ
jgi:hypothetical protein